MIFIPRAASSSSSWSTAEPSYRIIWTASENITAAIPIVESNASNTEKDIQSETKTDRQESSGKMSEAYEREQYVETQTPFRIPTCTPTYNTNRINQTE